MMTVKEHRGTLSGLKVAIVGDIAHSRVARSDVIGFTRMGSEVHLYGPATLVPKGIEQLGARVSRSLEEAIRDADVVMTLRIQRERQNDPLLPSLREYARQFGVSRQVLSLARPDALVMHPGPVNRGVELNPDVADGPQSVILDQVTNGVAVRMALLYLVMGNS
jgi:aspartate carbamoyltransferase catalytic subunit